jgi:hypothetical protein
MRTATAVFLTGLVSVTICSPAASAEPTAPPEAPLGGVVFVDNPAIVDPRPMRVESWSRAAGDNAINVNFTSGTDTCYGVHANVAETEQTVTVDLQGGTLPEAVDRACIMIALFGTLDVPLKAPLGDRLVLSAA